MITYKDVEMARERIKDYIYHTPLELSMNLSYEGTNIYLKLENQQKMRCAKIRGALSKMTSLTMEEKEKGVAAISSGNHGAAVSYASNLLSIKNVTIYVPKTTPKSKVEKIEYYGAEVIKLGKNYDEAHELGLKEIEESGKTFIDPCSDRVVLAGQGTIAMEILEENPHIDTIIVPIGGGGIITGISVAAKAIKKDIEIIGLQTAACPAMVAALRDEVFYEVYESEDSICDALVGGVGHIPYKMAKTQIDDIIEVEEEDIKDAVKHLILEEKIIAEPAGAIGVGAIKKNPKRFKGKNVSVVLTGGNIDKELMLDLVNKN